MSISGLTSSIKNQNPFAEGITKHDQLFPSFPLKELRIAILLTNTALTKMCSHLVTKQSYTKKIGCNMERNVTTDGMYVPLPI
jgi:hypothetical protein